MNGQVIVGNIIWMRNDYVSDVSFGGITYPTLEHAFQAAKVLDPSIKQEIADAESVKEARRLGRSATLRPDWDDSREKVMEALLRLKFTQSQELATRLAKTGSAEIVMEGYDDYWGTGKSGDGQNRLGEILEEIRTEVQAITGISGELEDEEDEVSADEVVNGPLKAALSDCPSDELIDACQQMYDGALALMTLVDKNDYDANLIARRTGIPLSVAQDAVAKLQKMQGAVSFISDNLDDGAVKIFDIGEPDDEDDLDPEEDPLTDDGDWFSLS